VVVSDKVLLWGFTFQALLSRTQEINERQLENIAIKCDQVLELAEKRFGKCEGACPSSKHDAEPVIVKDEPVAVIEETPSGVVVSAEPAKKITQKTKRS